MEDEVIITSKNKTARKKRRIRFTRAQIQRAMRMILNRDPKVCYNGA